MSTPSDKIASEVQNCSFILSSIKKFLSLMGTQQTEYSDISYIANGPIALVLRAKKNGIEEVALKVLECTAHTDYQIQAMEREYAIRKQLPSSDYFMAVQSQFFLTDMDERAEQDESGNLNTAMKVFFVQQMEICQGSLHDTIWNYSVKNKDPPSEAFKELFAIQMLDAVNLLHQKHIAHGNILSQNFLVSSSLDCPVLLKLCNFRFSSPVDSRNPVSEIQKYWIEQDLVSLGKVFLQLDSIGTKFDQFSCSNSEIAQPELKTMFQTHQLSPSTFLSKIDENSIEDLEAQSLLSPLANLLNLSSINLNLGRNKIGDLGAQSLLSPLANVLNFSSINLDLGNNQIGHLGAQSLLSPLASLLNLSSINVNLKWNQIGDIGAQSLLFPLSNHLNLSNINLDLANNRIGDLGALSLLSPLANLLNLSSINLDLRNNQIRIRIHIT